MKICEALDEAPADLIGLTIKFVRMFRDTFATVVILDRMTHDDCALNESSNEITCSDVGWHIREALASNFPI